MFCGFEFMVLLLIWCWLFVLLLLLLIGFVYIAFAGLVRWLAVSCSVCFSVLYLFYCCWFVFLVVVLLTNKCFVLYICCILVFAYGLICCNSVGVDNLLILFWLWFDVGFGVNLLVVLICVIYLCYLMF